MAKEILDECSLTRETEEALLGAILLDASDSGMEAISYAKSILEPFDFMSCYPNDRAARWSRTGRLYYACTQCKEPPNQIRVAWKLYELNLLSDDLRPWYISQLIQQCPTWCDYQYYANTVKELSTKRKIKYYTAKGNFEKVNQLTSGFISDQQLRQELKTSGKI